VMCRMKTWDYEKRGDHAEDAGTKACATDLLSLKTVGRKSAAPSGECCDMHAITSKNDTHIAALFLMA
jgi:hypothetical protein